MQLESDSLAALPVGEVLAEFHLHESLTYYVWVTIGCPVSGPGVRADEPQRRDDVAVSAPVVVQRRDDAALPSSFPLRMRGGRSVLAGRLVAHRQLALLARRYGAVSDFHDSLCRQLAGELIGAGLQ